MAYTTYVPSDIVNAGHGISGSMIHYNQQYLEDLLTGPVVIFGLGLCSLLVLNVVFCIRCCYQCARCGPKPIPSNGENTEEWAVEARRDGRTMGIVLIVFSICTIGVATGLIAGSVYVDNGLIKVDGVIDAINQAKSIFTSFNLKF